MGSLHFASGEEFAEFLLFTENRWPHESLEWSRVTPDSLEAFYKVWREDNAVLANAANVYRITGKTPAGAGLTGGGGA